MVVQDFQYTFLVPPVRSLGVDEGPTQIDLLGGSARPLGGLTGRPGEKVAQNRGKGRFLGNLAADIEREILEALGVPENKLRRFLSGCVERYEAAREIANGTEARAFYAELAQDARELLGEV